MEKLDSADQLPTNFACQLNNLGVIKLEGEQAVSYLQGQITANVEKLEPNHFMLGCHCDFKGKTWNVFYVFGEDKALYLVCHQESIPASLAELKKYGVFSKVDITDDTENWTMWGGAGDQFERASQHYFPQMPTGQAPLLTSESGYSLFFAKPQSRYMLMLPASQQDKVAASLADIQFSSETWELQDIQAGMANIQHATSNEFVPQMLNMQALDAIDFQKGCYMGQEVVARTKYLGKNKRACFILSSEQPGRLAAGELLEMQVGENWRRGGAIIRAAILEKQSWILAVLPNDTQVGDRLRSKDRPEQLFTVQALPYTIE